MLSGWYTRPIFPIGSHQMGGRDHGVRAEDWWGTTTPATFVSLSARTYVCGAFQFTTAGRVAGFRIYLPSGDTIHHWVIFWDVTAGVIARTLEFSDLHGSGLWVNTWTKKWYRITVGNVYRVAVLMGVGYQRTNSALVTPVTHGHITFVSSFQTTAIDPTNISPSVLTNANGITPLFYPD